MKVKGWRGMSVFTCFKYGVQHLCKSPSTKCFPYRISLHTHNQRNPQQTHYYNIQSYFAHITRRRQQYVVENIRYD